MKINPITRTELACCYGVSRKTFYNWIRNNGIKISNGYLKPYELKMVYDAFGLPNEIEKNNEK